MFLPLILTVALVSAGGVRHTHTPCRTHTKTHTKTESETQSETQSGTQSESPTASPGEVVHTPSSGVASPTEGNVHGDPHFIGLAGQHFKVIGPPGFFYNLYSSPDVQINALWYTSEGPSQFTVISEVGIRVGPDTVYLHRQGRLRVNDTPLPRTAEPFYFADGAAYIVRDPEGTAGEAGPTIVTPEFTVTLIPRGYEVDLTDFELTATPATTIHGLLGQTWNGTLWPAAAQEAEVTNQGELFGGLLEGQLADYVVADGLFGSSCTFSQFDTAQHGRSTEVAPIYSEFWKVAKGVSFDEALAAVAADNVDFLAL